MYVLCADSPGHTACGIDKYHMLLFGGRSERGRYLADTWIFSLLSLSWHRLHAKVGQGWVRLGYFYCSGVSAVCIKIDDD